MLDDDLQEEESPTQQPPLEDSDSDISTPSIHCENSPLSQQETWYSPLEEAPSVSSCTDSLEGLESDTDSGVTSDGRSEDGLEEFIETPFGGHLPDPNLLFRSREEAMDKLQKIGLEQGYSLRVGRSTSRNSNKPQRIMLQCSKARPPPKVVQGKTPRTFKGSSCPFSFFLKENFESGLWTISHRPWNPAGNIDYSEHNHPPHKAAQSHRAGRKLSQLDLEIIKRMAGVGSNKVGSIVDTIRNDDTRVTQPVRRDIVRVVRKFRKQKLEGYSQINALRMELDKSGCQFWSMFDHDDDKRVRRVGFAHDGGLDLARSYHTVILIDCTYKTNTFRMPLLNMIGVDACGKTFHIFSFFLSGEETGDFVWAFSVLLKYYKAHYIDLPNVVLTDCCLAAIGAIEQTFDMDTTKILICRWHANKNVVTKCKKFFTDSKRSLEDVIDEDLSRSEVAWKGFYTSWNELASSPTESEYETNLQEFENKYGLMYTGAVAYVKRQWLGRHKEGLVSAWVDKSTHFGNVTTSRVESTNARFKSYLRTSNLSLFEAFSRIKVAIESQLDEVQANQAMEQIRHTQPLGTIDLSAVQGFVSHTALSMVRKQHDLLLSREFEPVCTKRFTTTYGIPCVHELEDRRNYEPVLHVKDFHSQWIYHERKSGADNALLEPRVVYDNYRRRIEQQNTEIGTDNSTQREPSAFEYVERPTRPKALSTCSRCGIVGHRRNQYLKCPRSEQSIEKEKELQDAIKAAQEVADLPAAEEIEEPEADPMIVSDSLGSEYEYCEMTESDIERERYKGHDQEVGSSYESE